MPRYAGKSLRLPSHISAFGDDLDIDLAGNGNATARGYAEELAEEVAGKVLADNSPYGAKQGEYLM